MSDTEGHFLSGSSLDVLKVYENTLGSLGTQINRALGILCYTLECLEHQVKLTDIRKVMGAAAWTADVVVINVLFHLFL